QQPAAIQNHWQGLTLLDSSSNGLEPPLHDRFKIARFHQQAQRLGYGLARLQQDGQPLEQAGLRMHAIKSAEDGKMPAQRRAGPELLDQDYQAEESQADYPFIAKQPTPNENELLCQPRQLH